VFRTCPWRNTVRGLPVQEGSAVRTAVAHRVV
jgi:hypothetical protein